MRLGRIISMWQRFAAVHDAPRRNDPLGLKPMLHTTPLLLNHAQQTAERMYAV